MDSPCSFLRNSKAEWGTCMTWSRNWVSSFMPKIPDACMDHTADPAWKNFNMHTLWWYHTCVWEAASFGPKECMNQPKRPWYDWCNVPIRMTGQFLEGAVLQRQHAWIATTMGQRHRFGVAATKHESPIESCPRFGEKARRCNGRWSQANGG